MPNPTTATKPPLWEVQRARLESFGKAQVNFDLERTAEYTAENGWRIDDYEIELPSEQPGPPAEHGPWQAGQQILRNYTFPPSDLITGIFVPDAPLENRTMVLRAQFLFFTFWFGVRIGGVTDERRTLPDGTQEQVWGYNYRTLEGHFERGQIEFTIHKNLSTGRVVFHIHAFSQVGRIRNPFYWLGFRLFGRPLQRRFAHESLRRLREQVDEMLRTGASANRASDAAVALPAGALPPQ
ncbi:DUF1990 domain-containing protein [Hymenobacter lucidus]|uniref:DUF1990 domain-containing protein n=1 Tax=Hymenobacter lucidus TaxID=2880930 RepID=A0ABS8AW95_9BACT|nr:DUF1990 domain-containing protein [Hymenobacter lucidus]MCB2409776.1 DUF1990 domain-containing protein [Hymenobacter lucidus]